MNENMDQPQLPEFGIIVIYLKNTYPMTLKMVNKNIDDFVKDNLVPGINTRNGFITVRDMNGRPCGYFRAEDLVAFQIAEVPESEKWKQ